MSDTTQNLLNAAYLVGKHLARAFEARDMTPELRQAARAYAMTHMDGRQEGFVADMVFRATGGSFLTDGQCKGILNVMMADARKRLAAKAPTSPQAGQAAAVECPIGTYTIVGQDGRHLTIRLQAPRSKDGRVFASYLFGADNDHDFTYFATVKDGQVFQKAGGDRAMTALRAIITPGADLAAMGLAYALMSSNCYRCGRTLTVPASIHSGLGPDCAAKVGAAYEAPQVAEADGSTDAPTTPKETPSTTGQSPREVPASVAARYSSNGSAKTRYERDQDSGAPRPAAGYSYTDVFGTAEEQADFNPAAVR